MKKPILGIFLLGASIIGNYAHNVKANDLSIYKPREGYQMVVGDLNGDNFPEIIYDTGVMKKNQDGEENTHRLMLLKNLKNNTFEKKLLNFQLNNITWKAYQNYIINIISIYYCFQFYF